MTTGGLGYVMESAEFTSPTTIVEVKNATGEPSGLIAIPGFVSGRGTCQLATATYAIPTLGAVFTYANMLGTAITYVISNVAQPYAQQDIQKVNVEFRKRLNS